MAFRKRGNIWFFDLLQALSEEPCSIILGELKGLQVTGHSLTE